MGHCIARLRTIQLFQFVSHSTNYDAALLPRFYIFNFVIRAIQPNSKSKQRIEKRRGGITYVDIGRPWTTTHYSLTRFERSSEAGAIDKWSCTRKTKQKWFSWLLLSVHLLIFVVRIPQYMYRILWVDLEKCQFEPTAELCEKCIHISSVRLGSICSIAIRTPKHRRWRLSLKFNMTIYQKRFNSA